MDYRSEHEDEPGDGSVAPGTLSLLLRKLAAAPKDEGPPVPPLLAGTVLGRFALTREVGRGGFGVVWEAQDLRLGRRVAMKFVRPGLPGDLKTDQLQREAEAAARLAHDNIVALHDAGDSEHGPYLVLEYLQGKALSERLKEGRLDNGEALRVFREVVEGVAHAHAQGVVHRDLKPGNVFLCDDGRVKVLDFGLAHAFGQSRQQGGTPAYMAPEQWREAPEDERTDVFALGVMLYELLTGSLPFQGEKEATSERKAPQLEVAWAPKLGALVARMLEKDPTRRPRDAGEVAAALRTLGADLARAGPACAEPVRARWRPGRTARIALVGLVSGTALALLAQQLWRRSPALAEPVAIVVADFDNETGDPELDALSGLLITSLEQSPVHRVVTRGRALDLLRQAGKGWVRRIDEPLALEVARREGARALLLPSVRRFGGRLVVDLRAGDPAEGRTLFTAREATDDKGGLLAVLDRLADRVRSELGERTPSSGARALSAASLTGSLEAYRHYFLGQQAWAESRIDGALAEYRAALAADPGFALAHHGIAMCVYLQNGPDADRRAHADAAAAAANRLPEKEALMVRAVQARAYFRDDEARRLYAEALARFPDDPEVLVWAGNQEINAPTSDPSLAVSLSERMLRLDPGSELAGSRMTISLLRAGRADEAAAFARRWEAQHPEHRAACALVAAEVARRDLDAALAAARRCDEVAVRRPQAFYPMYPYAFWIHLLREESGAAAEVLTQARARGRGPERPFPAFHDAWLAAALGKQREAERLAQLVTRSARYPDEELVKLLAARGPSLELATALRELRDYTHKWDRTVGAVLAVAGASDSRMGREKEGGRPWPDELLRALEARSRGDLGAARALLAPRLALRTYADREAAAYALAQTCHMAGDARCVLDVAETYRYPQDMHQGLWHWRAWGWPRILYWSAVAHRRLGEEEGARRKAERVMRLWRDADSDLPMLAEAKALCRELRCRP